MYRYQGEGHGDDSDELSSRKKASQNKAACFYRVMNGMLRLCGL